MAFDSLISSVNRNLVNIFGPTAAQLIPSDGSDPVAITGILSDPPMIEGVSALTGGVVVEFFLNTADLTRAPQNGDVITIGATSYDVSGEPESDVGGGLTIRLRRNA